MDSNCQKIKLLKLKEILEQETNEHHPLRTEEIRARLSTFGISCDRRTLARDIETLNRQGFEVMSTFVGHSKAYYIEERGFSIPELRILIDAVQAAKFIPKQKSNELINKVANLGGSHYAEAMKRNMTCFNTCKHSNETVFYSVGTLEDALGKRKKVSFYYFDLNENLERVYRKNKQRYVIEPLALVFKDDNYYLVSYNSQDINNCRVYRIDRMENVEREAEYICEDAVRLGPEIVEYAERAFQMYNGPIEAVILEFNQELTGAVYDKFGEDTRMMRINPRICIATVQVMLSPVFWGWLFQFEGRMKLISPDSAIEQYRNQIEKARRIWHKEKKKRMQDQDEENDDKENEERENEEE